MNNPLFHSGETFYQSRFFPGEKGTVLQVVRNPVWWMPYLSCVIVTAGHDRPLRHSTCSASSSGGPVYEFNFAPAAWCFVGAVGLVLGAYLLMAAAGHSRRPQGLSPRRRSARLPVLDHGRVKPIDTLARISLMILSGRQEYTDDKGNTQPATRWLLDVMTAASGSGPPRTARRPGESRKVKAYRIEDPAIRAMLKLEGGPECSASRTSTSSAGRDGLEQLLEEAASGHSTRKTAEDMQRRATAN